MSESENGAETADEDLMMSLLEDVSVDNEYHVGYAEGSRESNMLRSMSEVDLIRWCPYPEECYVLTAAGREMLDQRRSQRGN